MGPPNYSIPPLVTCFPRTYLVLPFVGEEGEEDMIFPVFLALRKRTILHPGQHPRLQP